MSDSCANCSGRCCYDIVVRVTGIDAWRIARAQALRFEEIVETTDDPPDGIGAYRSGAGHRALFLAKSERAPSACTFLMHLPGDMRRCGVYADRPLVCAVYPMTIKNGSVDIRDDVSCAPGNWNFATLAYASWRRALATYAFEWALYSRIVARWNGEAHPASDADADFFAFVQRACDLLEGDVRGAAAVDVAAHWHEAAPLPELLERRRAFFELVDERAAAALGG